MLGADAEKAVSRVVLETGLPAARVFATEVDGHPAIYIQGETKTLNPGEKGPPRVKQTPGECFVHRSYDGAASEAIRFVNSGGRDTGKHTLRKMNRQGRRKLNAEVAEQKKGRNN